MTTKNNGENGLTSDEVLSIVEEHKSELGKRFGVKELSELTWLALSPEVAHPAIDFFVEFEGATTATAFFGAAQYLEDLIGHPVYLTTENALKNTQHPYAKGQTVVV